MSTHKLEPPTIKVKVPCPSCKQQLSESKDKLRGRGWLWCLNLGCELYKSKHESEGYEIYLWDSGFSSF